MNAKCRRVENLGLVVIDYLQLMTSAGGKRAQRRQPAAGRLRHLPGPEDHGQGTERAGAVPVSALPCQREPRPTSGPCSHDLRESGAIEQDADIVMFLYREDYYEKESENHNLAECIIAKNRHGETRHGGAPVAA